MSMLLNIDLEMEHNVTGVKATHGMKEAHYPESLYNGTNWPSLFSWQIRQVVKVLYLEASIM